MWQNTRTTHRYFSLISFVLLVCVLPETGAFVLIPSSGHGSSHDTSHGSDHAQDHHDVSHDSPHKEKSHHKVVHHTTGPTPPRKMKKKKHENGFAIDPTHDAHEHHHNDHIEPEELETEERERKIIFGNHQSFVLHDTQVKIAGTVAVLKKPFVTV